MEIQTSWGDRGSHEFGNILIIRTPNEHNIDFDLNSNSGDINQTKCARKVKAQTLKHEPIDDAHGGKLTVTVKRGNLEYIRIVAKMEIL